MGVNLIFKIAAVGILVSVMCQVLKHRPGISHESRRIDSGAVLDRAVYL